jgi:hypothetical protein
MRKLFTVLTAVLLTASMFAQSPEKMSYQAVIRNSSNALVTNTQIGMEINIRKGSESGTVVYTETKTPITNENGLVSIEIGGGASFITINWANDSYFIETKTAVVAPFTTYTIIGVSQLLSVPYALHAKTAESLTSMHYVGELYGGGIVFYVYDNGQHGLVAAIADQSTGIQWYNGSYSSTNAARDGIGAGEFNTERIITNQGVGSYAAQLCAYYQGGNYGDWYLPSLYELNLLYEQKSVVGGFASGFYWSSIEDLNDGALGINFVHGNQNFSDKSTPRYLRAIRAF